MKFTIFISVFTFLFAGCKSESGKVSSEPSSKEEVNRTVIELNDSLSSYADLNLALLNPDKVGALHFREGEFEEFPLEIFQFKNLRILDLNMNQIKVLPEEISILTKLEKLDLSYCSLEYLPESIGSLQNLKSLLLLENDIDSLPESIGSLRQLEKLHLGNNPIKKLPQSIGMIENLSILILGYDGEKSFSEAEKKNIKSLLPGCSIVFL
ncbi:MAG: leucine-rich repeat domain-containing protein [Bacteroidota bacterium]